MKTSDYVTLGSIAVIVTVIAYFLVNSIMGDPSEKSVKFEYIDGVSSDLVLPDEEVFNAAAINPTVEVYVGDCTDLNQDGELDADERRACGLETEQSSPDYLEENGGLSNEENEAINEEEGYARGTSKEQRDGVNADINEHTERGNVDSDEDNDNPRQETVSGS